MKIPAFTGSSPALLLVTTALTLIACTQAGEAPEAPREIARYDAEIFFDTTSVRGASFSADGRKILFSSDATGTFEVYSQPVGGGAPEQLTTTEGATYSVSYFPNDDRVLFTRDEGGNELNHLYVRELDGSERDLTPAEGARGSFLGWAGDDASFWVGTNERDASVVDLYRYNVEDYSRELVFQNPGNTFLSEISRDGRWLVYLKLYTNANSDLFLVDLSAGETEGKLISEHEGDAMFRTYAFSPDSSQLIYSTDEGSEFTQAWTYDLESSAKSPLMQPDWDVSAVYYSRDGRYRVSAINADASTQITVADLEGGKDIEVPLGDGGDLGAVTFSRDSEQMAFYLTSDTAPANLYAWTIGGDEAPRRLTSTLSDKINEDDLVGSEVVRYASYDGLEIPGILYRPHNSSADDPAPVMLFMHGGPGGQSRKGYTAEIQHLVNQGYGIFAVNNRGSSGYGKTFFHLDDRKHGEADLDDCVAAIGYLKGLEWVDGERIGIMGGSYGGYLVAAALAFRPDAFDVGVNIFGVTNWVRTMESIPAWWGPQRDMLIAEMGDPVEDAERLRAISPVFHGDKIVKPMLVVQGANDPRVMPRESEDLVAAARANGAHVEYVLFDDEGHGFRNKVNRITAQNAYVDFLDTWLRGDGAAAEPSAEGESDGEGGEPSEAAP